jgi:hypothetical protein
MFTMKLEFDQDKLAKDPELDPELVVEWLDKICEDTYFIKIGTGEYKLQDDEDPIGALLVLISRFKKQSWLIQNLKTWQTFDDEEGEQDALKTVLED